MDITLRGRTETAGPPPPVWCLTVLHHPSPAHVGVRIAITAGDDVALGRGGDALGPRGLDDPRLSRRHARLVVDADDQLRILDDGSTNGTLVNGQQVIDQRLAAGDVVEVGNLLLLITRGPERYLITQHPLLVGGSPAMVALYGEIARVAGHATTVLVTGETGVGKELVARAIHAESGRTGPLIPIDCGAVPERGLHEELFGVAGGGPGLLARAHNGTVLLDSIGDASPALQAALLRFLDRGEVRPIAGGDVHTADVRVIATRRDHDGATLRDDFLARLARFTIRVPPLRERREDVPALIAHLARNLGADVRIHRGLMLALVRYAWPRNVRELEAVIERAWIERTGPQLELTPAIAEVIGGDLGPGAAPAWPADAFLVARDGSWFRPPRSPRVAIGHRPTLAAIARVLVEHHLTRPGQPLALADLIAAGWPSERMIDDSGANRAYVAIATLRKLGLRDALVKDDAGYALSSATGLVVV